MEKFLDISSCLLRLLNFAVVSVFGRIFTSLASVFNIVHTFVCGDDVGPSITNANELISDGGVNVNSEMKALACAKFSAYVEFSAYFYLYPEAIAGCDSFKLLMPYAERRAMVLAYGYGLSIDLIKTYIIELICKYTLILVFSRDKKI